MGNFNTTRKELKNYIFARVPLVIINSSERERIDTLPELMDNEDSVNSLGKELCEHLLKEALHNDWEDSYCTKNALWCLGTN